MMVSARIDPRHATAAQAPETSAAAAWSLRVAAVALPLLFLVAAAWYDRVTVDQRMHADIASTTDALTEHATKVMETGSLVLGRVLDRVRDLDWTTIGGSRDVHEFLKQLEGELPQIASVFLVDPHGYDRASSRAFPMPTYDLRARSYYLDARGGDPGLFVSAPFRGMASGSVAFTLSRARLVNGRFDGVVVASFSPDYFETFYRSVLRLPGTVAGLVRQDGAVLLRYPALQRAPMSLPAGNPLMRAIAASKDTGVFRGRSPVDGVWRVGGFSRVAGQKLFAVYAVDPAASLADWYVHVAIFAAFALLVALGWLWLVQRALRHAEEERVSLRRLLAETERRQVAEASLQQAQKLEALGRLTGGVAHDFNNLLTVVLGAVELLSGSVTEQRTQRLLAAAESAARRGARLTRQMLAFSRNRATETGAVDANQVIRGLDELLRGTLGPLVDLHYDLQDDLWLASGDPTQFDVVLLNLAVNARDAMPKGGRFTVRTRNVTLAAAGDGPAVLAGGDYVVVAVEDSGDGMDEAVQANAFEPFFTTKPVGKGTGLGLSIVYGFATRAGGTATIDSAPAKGARISLYLPRSTGIAETEPAAASASTAAAAGLRILLLDDDVTVCALTREMLEQQGHFVTEAHSAEAALSVLRSDAAVDLLLTDFAMPGMNGGELAAAARRLRPQLRVLLVTGFAQDELLRDAVGFGQRILRKPFTSAELAGAVHAATGPGRDALRA